MLPDLSSPRKKNSGNYTLASSIICWRRERSSRLMTLLFPAPLLGVSGNTYKETLRECVCACVIGTLIGHDALVWVFQQVTTSSTWLTDALTNWQTIELVCSVSSLHVFINYRIDNSFSLSISLFELGVYKKNSPFAIVSARVLAEIAVFAALFCGRQQTQ